MNPLISIRVLDLTDGNPYLGSLLADYGAELLKIEPPHSGDSIRKRGTPQAQEQGIYQAYYNRCKKSVCVDITNPQGQELIKRLAKQCDMLVVNSSQEELAKLNLSYEQLKAENPKLIYGALTPFGEEGPWKDMPYYDLFIMARTGLLDKTGFPEKPTRIGVPLAYYYGSYHLGAGMLAALLQAQETGEGSFVSVSAWQSLMSVDDTYAQCLLAMNELPRRIANGFPTTNPTDTFKCKNGYFALSIGSDKQWWAFCEAAGRHDWAEDPRYKNDPIRSEQNYFGDLDGQLVEYFSNITIEEADRICREAMVPGGPCNTVKELVSDEQVAARQMLIEINDPILGNTLQLGKAAKFLRDTENDNLLTPAPQLSQHTKDVLKRLPLNDEELEELKQSGAISF